MPRITLYRANGACSIVAHSLLLHLSVPFISILLKPCSGGYKAATGTCIKAEYIRTHPQGYVPALVADGVEQIQQREAITELLPTLTYIRSIASGDNIGLNLLGRDGVDSAGVYEGLTWLSGTLHGLGYGMLWRPGRFSEDVRVWDGIRANGKIVVDASYQILRRLTREEFAVGATVTVTAVDFNLYIF
jgi:glutathione S-transferase